MTTAAYASRDSLSLGRVVATLSLLLVLALVLPFAAVRTLHARRLETADRDLQALAVQLEQLDASRMPAGVDVLVGTGSRPHTIDERWNSASSLALSRVLPGAAGEATPDPWGNAYLVVVSGTRRPAWVISAGADGILQTPFGSEVSTPSGDDRAARVRPR